jgi:hypothetical protein
MASVMADNMDMLFLPSKYDMRKLEVQDRLHFTLNRLFAADMIIFILSIRTLFKICGANLQLFIG